MHQHQHDDHDHDHDTPPANPPPGSPSSEHSHHLTFDSLMPNSSQTPAPTSHDVTHSDVDITREPQVTNIEPVSQTALQKVLTMCPPSPKSSESLLPFSFMQSVHIPALSTSPSSQHAGKQVDLAQVLADSLAMYTDKIANKDTRDVTPDMLQVSNFIPRQSQPVYDVDEAVDGLAPFSHNSKTETSEYFLQADEEEEDEDEDAVCHITSVMHRSAIKELQCAINSLTPGSGLFLNHYLFTEETMV